MSVIDRILGAVTPPVSEEKQAEAAAEARRRATPGGWLSMALDHHDEIRAAFQACREASAAADRTAAMQRLGLILNGHALAEEVVLYPALAQAGEKIHAGHAYMEQTTAKMQMAELENIAPSTPEWLDKVRHIEGAVLTHIYEEESSWFLELADKAQHQDRLTARYAEEFSRYCGAAGAAG
jgi:hypothetical protein